MAFQTAWVYEPHIIASTYSAPMTGGDFDMNMLELLGIVQAMPLYILIDLSATNFVPARLFDLSSPALVMNHENTRWFAVVTPGENQRRTTQLLARHNVKLFTDRVMAMAFLRAMVRVDTGIILDERPARPLLV